MNVTGIWELVSTITYDPTTFEKRWTVNEDLRNLPDDDYVKMLLDAMFEFTDDGKLSMYCSINTPLESIPEDELKEAVESGEVAVIDGKLKTIRHMAYKEEDGIIIIDSGEKGEVFGEPINPWKPVAECGNTLILLDQYQVVRQGEVPTEVKKTVKEEKQGTPEMAEASGTYKGLYTKFVGDPETAKDSSKEFKLVLNPNGTGTHYRDDLEINVKDWTIENGEFKMTEKFLGTIDYTGKLEGTKLSIFNNKPTDPFTCEYVYEKE